MAQGGKQMSFCSPLLLLVPTPRAVILKMMTLQYAAAGQLACTTEPNFNLCSAFIVKKLLIDHALLLLYRCWTTTCQAAS
jgi:hypothetical protein